MDWETFSYRWAVRRVERWEREARRRERQKWVAWTVACLGSLLAWYIIVVAVWSVMS